MGTNRQKPRSLRQPGRQQERRTHFTVQDITGWQQDEAKREP